MSNKLLLGVIAFLVVIAGGYYFMKRTNYTNTPANTTQEQTTIPPSAAPSASDTMSPSGILQITVQGNEFAFIPATITVRQGQPVQLTFKNTGKFTHNLTISDLNVQTKTVQAGQEDSVQFTPSKTGQFTYICTVDSHADKGMKGTLIVQ